MKLDAVAHRFRSGSRLRLIIAGGWHPRYARNLGIGEPYLTGLQMKTAMHAVRFGASQLLLSTAAAGAGTAG
jgi:predicted acyl esterase